MIPENTHKSFFNPTDVENAIVTSSWKDFLADMNSLLQLGRLGQYDCLIGVKDGYTYYYFTPKLSDEDVKEIELMGYKSMNTEDCFAVIPFNIQFDRNFRSQANSLSFNSMFVATGNEEYPIAHAGDYLNKMRESMSPGQFWREVIGDSNDK